MKFPMVAGSLAAAALAGAIPGTGSATEVAGRMEIDRGWLDVLEGRAGQQATIAVMGFWQVGNGAASVDPVLVDASQEIGILVRPKEKRDLPPLSTEEPVIEVRSVAFFPSVVWVAEGKRILIRNMDLFDHEMVVEDDSGNPIELEPLEGGRAYRATFKKSGLYAIRCELFPFMRGYVIVEKSGAGRFVRPDPVGRFSLGDLPPGKYVVRVFNASSLIRPGAGTAAEAARPPVWVPADCEIDVPSPQAAPQPPPAPAAPPGRHPARPETAEAAAPSAPPTPALELTLRLGRRGDDEALECSVSWPQPAQPAQPAAGNPVGR